MTKKKPPFDKRQIKDFVKEVKAEAGAGWEMLGTRFQHAVVVERAYYILAGQDAEYVETETITWLVQAMLTEAELAG